MAKIGFLGAGNMGAGMASCLIKAGHQVHIYNRSLDKLKPLIELGGFAAETPREAAKDAEVIFAMVGDDRASKAVWLGDDGALGPAKDAGSLIIECSTLSRDWVEELANKVSESGLDYLDAPVTGLPNAAANGELVLFMGGETSTINRAQAYLDIVSKEQIHFGPIGAGTAYKLIVNLMGSIQIAATAEAMLAAEAAGLDLDKVAYALGSGGSGSPAVARSSHLMAEGEHEKDVQFSAYWRLKDTRYGVELSNAFGTSAELGQVALEQFQKLVDAGFADSAESKLFDVLKNS